MKQYLTVIALLLVCACSKYRSEADVDDVLVRIKDRTVTRSEIEKIIPKGLSPEDSTLKAEALIKNRVTEMLTDDAARRNVRDDAAEIEQLVDEYRKSLVRHRYQEQIVRDRVSTEISEAEEIEYYDANKEQFVLDQTLIRGIFLKTPVGAPNLNDVRKWYVSQSEESLEKIEKYSIGNAVEYDFFYDRWVRLEDVLTRIALPAADVNRIVRANGNIEISDSTFVYFLNITDNLTAGKTAPFEFVRTQIQNMLVNKRKVEYLRQFREKMYLDAIKNRVVVFLKE
ncbi:MAG: peptidyl-prolyl cis-trans isomerase [Tannerella sp.]|jgi:hypothetical protein|nr:peptidyl-prolyl cis-trans isomerase [Tannerella sp.]